MAKRIIIVGGGLAGLTAAATAAREGAEVLVLEARSDLGGRARTVEQNGFLFNEGAHALYVSAPGIAVLRTLGVEPKGKRPMLRGFGQLRGNVALMPGTPADLLRSPLIGWRAKAQLGKLLASPAKLLTTPTQGRSLQQWIEEHVSHPDARLLVAAAARTATYVHELDTISAQAGVPQTVGALTPGVIYLDHGWQQIVDGLRDVATRAGAKIDSDAKVDSLQDVPDADAVILAVGGPAQVAKIVGRCSSTAESWAQSAEPVFAATLDIGLVALPLPDRRFCLSVDSPLYFSVHTPAAALTRGGGEVAHVMRYGSCGETAREEMETFLDQVQPGWREQVRAEKYGRQRLVAHDRPRTEMGSLSNRPGCPVPDVDGVFVAGDWVGSEGMLADASIASGAAAARLALTAK